RTWSLLGGREIEALVHLPQTNDAEFVASMRVLTGLIVPALFTDANLLALLVCRMVNLGMVRGTTEASCYAYVWLGVLAGPRFGNYAAGFRFGQLGYDLAEQRDFERFRAATWMSFGVLIVPWTRHVRIAGELIRRALAAASAVGDLTTVAYCGEDL